MKRKSPQTNPEFERFKEFTKKLMAVPKKEIDPLPHMFRILGVQKPLPAGFLLA